MRCYTCNSVLNFLEFETRTREVAPRAALEGMRIDRFCCRRMYLTHPFELESLIRMASLRDADEKNYAMKLEASTTIEVRSD